MKKNLLYGAAICCMLMVSINAIAQDQSILNNGRAESVVPSTPTVIDQTKQVANANDLNEIDDADIPGTYYLQGGSDEEVTYGGEGPNDLLDRLDNLESELNQLRLNNEQLTQENQSMKMEMSNCCAEASAHLNMAGSYLLQNSPNPFQSNTNIQYFIEDAAQNAKLEVRNVDGVLLQTYDLEKRGVGELRLDRSLYKKGSFVYTLSVDGKIIDSKVMILQ